MLWFEMGRKRIPPHLCHAVADANGNELTAERLTLQLGYTGPFHTVFFDEE